MTEVRRMELHNEQIKNKSARSRVIETVREWIDDGILRSGNPIPPEREIAATVGVGLRTVQLALKILENQGLIERQAGRTRTVTMNRAVLQGVQKTSGDSIQTRTVYVLTGVRMEEAFQNTPGMQEVIRGVLVEAQKRNLHVLFIHPSEVNEAMIEELASREIYGVLIDSGMQFWENWDILERLENPSLPVVVQGKWQGLEIFDKVIHDHQVGAYDLAALLIQKYDLKQLLFFGASRFSKYSWVSERLNGLRKAAAEFGLPELVEIEIPSLIFPLKTACEFRHSVRLTAGYFLDYLPENTAELGLFCSSDGLVPVASAALKLNQKDVPFLVGYDNVWQFKEWFDDRPPAATVDKNNQRIGEEMVRLLVERQQNPNSERVTKVIPHNLIEL